MISIAFVNGESEPILSADPCSVFIRETNALVESVQNDIKAYEEHLESFKMESSLSGFENIDTFTALEKEGEGIFTKIGNAIIKVLTSFIETMKGFLDKFKNFGFKNKSDMDKIDAMIKKHPELKDKIVGHASDFDFKDIDSLSRMEEQFNAIMKATDTSTIGKIKKKFGSGADKTVKVAAGAGTVIGLVTAVQKMKSNHTSMEKKLRDGYDSARKCRADILKELNNIKSGPHDDALRQVLMERLNCANDMTREYFNIAERYRRREASLLGKIQNMLGVGLTPKVAPR